MSKINLEKCVFSCKISVDGDGNFDDSLNGKYGYRVYFTVPLDELSASGLFKSLPDDCCEGEIEFSINENGEQVRDVLLWTSVEDEDGSVSNDDFVYYEEDITELISHIN